MVVDMGDYGVIVKVALSPRLISGTPSSHPLMTCPTPMLVSNGLPMHKSMVSCATTAVARRIKFRSVEEGSRVVNNHFVSLFREIDAVTGLTY